MNKEQMLEMVQERLNKVLDELQEKADLLRNEDFASDDPDGYQAIDFKATHLDGELTSLAWVRDLLQK